MLPGSPYREVRWHLPKKKSRPTTHLSGSDITHPTWKIWTNPLFVPCPILPGFLLPKGKLSFVDKKKAVDDAVEWIRKNDVKPVNLDEPTTMALANAAGMSMPRGSISADDKKKAAEAALDWLRNIP
jgi:hypothetical protein